MRDKVLAKCELFVQNYTVISKTFKFESEYMSMASASILTTANVLADADKLKELEKLIISKTKVLSEFRSFNKNPLICKLATVDNPEAHFDRIVEIQKALQGRKFTGQLQRIIAAMVIAEYVGDSDYSIYVERTEEIHAKMAKNHVWLTDNADIPYAAMLAVSNRDVDQLIDDMERCYKELKPKFGSGNPLQSLTHIMALQTEPSDYKCAKVTSIFRDLKVAKRSMGSGDQLPILGALCLVNLPNQTIIDMISEGDDYIKNCKRTFGFGMDEKSRRMFASQFLLDVYIESANTEDSVSKNTLKAVNMAIETFMMNAAISANDAAIMVTLM